MKVVGLYKKDGVLKGFCIEDDGFYSVVPQALYLETTMKELIAAGYSYVDYDPEHIKLPNGDSIMSVEEQPITEQVLVALRMSGRSANHVLSDAEASRYYVNSTGTSSSVEFAKYNGEYLVNTREELEAYCAALEQVISRNSASVVVRPLNTVVNPEIWFTPEEIFGEHHTLYSRLMNTRKWCTYEHFLQSCAFFIDEGLMRADDISARAFLQAWYSYGPDLIKGTVVSSKHRYDVDEDIIFGTLNTAGLSRPLLSNRVYAMLAYNANSGTLASSTGEVIDADSYLTIENGNRLPIWCEDSFIQKAQMNNSKNPITLTRNGRVSDATDRFECNISYNGRTYSYRADMLRTILLLDKNQRLTHCPMSIATSSPSARVTLNEIKNADGYAKYIVTQAYVMNLAKSRTDVPIGSYNVDYLNQLKMNPLGVIIKYTCRKNPAKIQLPFLSAWNNYCDSLANALQEYSKPIPQYIYDAFNIPESVSTKEEFLDKVDVGPYLSKLYDSYGMSGEEDGLTLQKDLVETYVNPKADSNTRINQIESLRARGFQHEPYNYYLFIKLVHDAITGRDIYGCLEEGHALDAKISLDIAINAILATANCIAQKEATLSELLTLLPKLDEYIDLAKVFRKRSAAAVGFVRDFATDAELMFSRDNIYWCYVTKVFRELSNKPVNEQRPYLLEILAFDKTKEQDVLIRDAFMQIVEEVLEANPMVPEYDYNIPFDTEDKTITNPIILSKKFAGYFAIKLMFRCLIGINNGKIDASTPYTEKSVLFEGKEVSFTVPVELLAALRNVNLDVHRKYITTEYYCRGEVARVPEKSVSQLSCANAYITPWSVEALPGYAIRSYPLMYNYFNSNTLIQSFGTEKVTALVESKAKLIESIKERVDAGWALQEDPTVTKMMLKAATSYADLDVLLEDGQAETTEAYIKRWTLAKAEAKAKGKTLLSIPLKQDVLFDDIANSLGYEVDTTPVFVDDATVGSNFLDESIISLPRLSSTFITAKDDAVANLAPLTVHNISAEIVDNIMTILGLPVINTIAFCGSLFDPETKQIITPDYIYKNFYKVTDTTYVAKTTSGFYVYTL